YPSTAVLYLLPVHDALPIFQLRVAGAACAEGPSVANRPGDHGRGAATTLPRLRAAVLEGGAAVRASRAAVAGAPPSVFLLGKERDRKSTRLNSSHGSTSYAV